MSQENLTHKDLAKLLGVSETTVKSYRRKFPGCIPVSNKGKPIRFSPQAASVALRIRELFGTGMSVPEVRARLAGEFDWINEKLPEQVKKSVPEQGLSGLARSMVEMSGRQSAMLKRMQSIEAMLAELGLAGAEEVEKLRGSRAEAARRAEERLEERLNSIGRTTDTLSETVRVLADQLGHLLERRAAAKENWDKERTRVVEEAAVIAGRTEPMEAGQAEETGARVIPIRQEPEAAARPESVEEPARAEPPRSFFTLPLVVRTEQGVYVGAGGRARGRFSLNDLKAVLVYGFPSAERWHMGWEAYGQGWRLILDRPGVEEARVLSFLLMELPTKDGAKVAEILQLKDGDRQGHPAEFAAILDALLG